MLTQQKNYKIVTWKTYVSELFDDNRPYQHSQFNCPDGLPITTEELGFTSWK